MKTTVEIPNPVLSQAKAVAQKEGTTVRALVEEGLRKILKEREQKPKFKLRDASVGGQGLQPPFEDGSWEKIRDAIYEGRGA
jgi:hypothetical protein